MAKALAAVPGVAVRRVDVGAATVAHDPSKVGHEALAVAVREAGYEVGPAVP